jgi:uncharacterized protein (TIGR03435 family)
MPKTILAIACAALLIPLFAAPARPPAPTPPGPVAAATPSPAFEAASIHLVDPHTVDDLQRGIGQFSMSQFPTDLFTAKNASLPFLLQITYSVDTQENISAMPGWMDSQLYDISAKVEGDRQLSLEQMRPLLQQLLAQRFHLAVHRESRLVSGFALVVAKGGPKLQPPAKPRRKLGAQILPNGLDAWNMDLAHFVLMLARPAGQPIVDKTGLTGLYDFKLSYAPANDPDSSLPSFFTAVQDQLGLKLEPQKVPVETLVIDHVDRIPTEN